MDLEIIIHDNLIRISAGWVWCVIIGIWLLWSIVINALNIYKHYLELKIAKRKGG